MSDRVACVFCRIVDHANEPGGYVAEEEDVVAFLDIHPINEGHSVVVPRAHIELVADVDESVAAAMWSLARRTALAIRTSGLRCEGIDYFLADGEAAGQEVPHTHLHVIPRWRGDGFGLRLPAHHGPPAARPTLDDVAERIRRRL